MHAHSAQRHLEGGHDSQRVLRTKSPKPSRKHKSTVSQEASTLLDEFPDLPGELVLLLDSKA